MSISNNPPPFETWSLHIEELFEEAGNFLDGEPILTQGQADAVGVLLDALRTAKRDADAERAKEKKPHDDAGKAVQAIWKPLLDKCDLAVSTAKKALTPWLQHLDDIQREAAEKARHEAEEARLAAIEAHRAASTDLAAAERAEELEKAAAQAQKLANRADKAKPQAMGGARAIGLRTSYAAIIDDQRALLNHYAKARPADLIAWLQDQADSDVRAGARNLPGVRVEEIRTAA
jgi:hypothetical protein